MSASGGPILVDQNSGQETRVLLKGAEPIIIILETRTDRRK